MTSLAWWQQALLVGLGGGLGSMGRHAVSSWLLRVAGTGFPWGTLAVNLIGSLLAGLALAWLHGRGEDAALWWRVFVMVGLLGGFTTFSAMSVDVLLLQRSGVAAWAAIYLALSLLGGLILVYCGWWLGAGWRMH